MNRLRRLVGFGPAPVSDRRPLGDGVTARYFTVATKATAEQPLSSPLVAQILKI
jgi:hypothetical protein